MVALAALVLGAAFAWWLLLAPAVRTLKSAATEQALLTAQLSEMRSLQTQALALQGQTALAPAESRQQLQSLCDQMLGPHSLQLQGPQATVTLQQVPASRLGEWLVQARTLAHATAQEAHLTYANGSWSGTLVLALP